MKLHRIAPVVLFVLSPALVHCEVVEVPPPAAPQQPAPPQPAPPAPPQDQAEAPQGDNADSYDDQDPTALTDFHSTLDPYGQWVDDPTYGTVWVPNSTVVGSDFTPYSTAGHWTYDSDYVWVSDYPWGWAPFHYGRWVLVDGRGWSWVPGRVYRGAWVTWGADDGYGYAGWYPAAPAFVWRGGAAVAWSGPVLAPRWTYVPRGEVFSPTVGRRVITGPAAVSIAARVRPVSAGVGGGPPPARFGFHDSDVPHPSATAVGRAQQFAHPSTAVAVGGHPPALAGRGTFTPPGGTQPGVGAQVQGRENGHPGNANAGGQGAQVQGHENGHPGNAGGQPGREVEGHENQHPVPGNGRPANLAPAPQRSAPAVRGGGGRPNSHHR
jgi:hypothetical protein